jgi:hypothetical protein
MLSATIRPKYAQVREANLPRRAHDAGRGIRLLNEVQMPSAATKSSSVPSAAQASVAVVVAQAAASRVRA